MQYQVEKKKDAIAVTRVLCNTLRFRAFVLYGSHCSRYAEIDTSKIHPLLSKSMESRGMRFFKFSWLSCGCCCKLPTRVQFHQVLT